MKHNSQHSCIAQIRPRRKEKRTASSVHFFKAKERKRELCQTRKEQGKERSITLFMRKTCTNERTREQLTKATEFWQIKTNKNCAKEEKEIPDKSPREWPVDALLPNSEMENPAIENPQRKQERGNECTPRGVAAAMAGASVRAKYSTLPYTFLSDLAGNSDPWLGSIVAVGPGSFSFVMPGKALL